MKNRTRIILDVPAEVLIAIKLRAAKDDEKTGDVVSRAVQLAFPADIASAIEALAEREAKGS